MMPTLGLYIETAIGVIGFALLVYGIGQWSKPGAYVVAGAVLLAVALWPAAQPAKGR